MKRFVKRSIDTVVSLLGLILLSPAMAVVALLIRLRMGKPVLFKQTRPGLHGLAFDLYKFRTMTGDAVRDGREVDDAERLTLLGRKLRKFSLDELPQLWSVLKGDMSLVGPRPLLMEYLPLYSPAQARRHEGLPRALIEAMARGLPCIGSTVGGIPELLPREDLVPPNDAAALAAKIKEVLNKPERMSAMSCWSVVSPFIVIYGTERLHG